MSTEAFSDVSIADCLDSILDKYIAMERKITRKTEQIIEILFKFG
jgi:hypothetical protein